METWQAASIIIGCIGGLLAIVNYISTRSAWRGSIDSKIKLLTECMNSYPPAEMYTMVKALWKIYVLDALSQRPDLASHSSPLKLYPATENLIPEDVRESLDVLRRQRKDDIKTGFTVADHFGPDKITEIAKRMGTGPQLTVAILSTYLENSNNHQSAKEKQ